MSSRRWPIAVAIVVGLFVSLVMLVPVGSSTEVRAHADGSKYLKEFYWSLGTAILFQWFYPMVDLSPFSIFFGVALARGAAGAAYVLSRRILEGRST